MYVNVTQVDLALATAYFPILVEMAKAKETLTYSQLVGKAKQMYPQNDLVQSAIPVSTGRRLDVVRAFTQDLDVRICHHWLSARGLENAVPDSPEASIPKRLGKKFSTSTGRL